MLKVVLGVSSTYEGSIQTALNAYNADDEGYKTFHYKETGNRLIGQNPQYVTEIWYTVAKSTKQIEQEKHQFVGHQGIDPNDPNWREKWEALNAVAVEATEETLKGNDPQHTIAEVMPTVDLEVSRAQSE